MAESLGVAGTLEAAVAVLRTRLPVQSPVAAIVLGSGLGGLANRIDGATRVVRTSWRMYSATSGARSTALAAAAAFESSSTLTTVSTPAVSRSVGSRPWWWSQSMRRSASSAG